VSGAQVVSRARASKARHARTRAAAAALLRGRSVVAPPADARRLAPRTQATVNTAVVARRTKAAASGPTSPWCVCDSCVHVDVGYSLSVNSR
jgi:hypothetical protein